MKMSVNRSASFSLAGLSIVPIGLLVVLLQYTSWRQIADQGPINPYALITIFVGLIALSVLSFSDKPRPSGFWLCLLIACFLLAAIWPLAIPGTFPLLPILLQCLPMWLLWRQFRGTKRVGRAA